ncbi:MAG: hypothetical protein V4649_15525 [Bacteroidota bacterium]
MNTVMFTPTRIAVKMKTLFIVLVLIALQAGNATAQPRSRERFGNTLNLGLGIGYYGYLQNSVLFLSGNYEFDVARNFTLAPFIGFTSYRSNSYRWSGSDHYYRRTVMPMGVKGTYYFDRLLGAGPKWDFYLAASLGFVYDRVVWTDGYFGDKSVARAVSPLYLDFHIGTEYHINRRVGLFLDLSTGVSTFGLAVHGRR